MGPEPTVNGMGVFSVDFNLFKDGELHVVIFIDKFLDFLLSSRLLALELVARESQDFESFILELFSDLVELLIIRVSVGTQARHINYQKGLSILEFRK